MKNLMVFFVTLQHTTVSENYDPLWQQNVSKGILLFSLCKEQSKKNHEP